jgi:hypothetical protein
LPQYCAIAAPIEYVECLQQTQQEVIFKVKTQIAAAINDAAVSDATSMSNGGGGSTDDERKDARQLASAAISRKFMARPCCCVARVVLIDIYY